MAEMITEVNGNQNDLVTNINQNILFHVPQKKEVLQVWKNRPDELSL